jgi:hypothetical protein
MKLKMPAGLWMAILITSIFSLPITAQSPVLIEGTKIWEQGGHNAFTGLVYHQAKFFCTFREGTGHVPGEDGADGGIRVIVSADGADWESMAYLTVDGYDLRDPKLSITPEGRLMLLMGAADYRGKIVKHRLSMVSFANPDGPFSQPVPVNMDPRISNDSDWLWRVNWHEQTGYGVMYQNDGDLSKSFLVKTGNGIDYQLVKDLELEGKPNEATVKFTPDHQMIMIIRREAANKHGLLGKSRPPYQQWEWQDMGMRLGGPDFIILPDGRLLLGSRVYGETGHTTGLLVNRKNGTFEQVAEFPSGGDTSYPGMVLLGDTVYVSYYSSHQDKTAIYFAVVPLKQLKIKD